MSEIPDNLSYTKDHEWMLVDDDGKIRVGITDHAQDALSDVVFVELPEIGSKYSEGDAMAVAESVKAASDIYAPVSGEIVEVNDKLEESPELINESPYEFGWMVVMVPDKKLENSLDSESYRKLID
ncbi:MAG: glycine cleavage system protein GcvH [archaeon]|nr:glycine cleavage system protein GcvH [archaeon]